MIDIKKTLIIVAISYGAIAVINGILKVGSSPNDNAAPVTVSKVIPKKMPSVGEVIRKNYLVPGMDFEESVFYIGEQEVAKQKIINGKIVEVRGNIPDGKVKLVDEYRGTYGQEFYLKGRKHGPAEIYYKDGMRKSSSQYLFGQLVTYKEFYINGAVRMEADYGDAIVFLDDLERETGAGKVYFRDGTLKYEWNFTKNNPANYKKSYNRNGELTLELYYDKDGNLIRR